MRNLILTLTILALSALTAEAALKFNPELPLTPAELGPVGGGDAQVATDGETYAVIWTDARAFNLTVYAARLKQDGTLLDPTGIAIPNSRQAGSILWTGRTFLLVYIDDNRSATARTLSPEGVLGDPVELFGIFYLGPSRLRMATNGTSVLVVSTQATAALLDLDGRKVHQFPMPWIVAQTGIDVAAAGSTYLVAGGEAQQVKTQIVTAEGTLGASLTLPGTGVALASDGNRFLLVYGRDALRAQLIASDGSKSGEERLIASDSSDPAVAVWRNGEYLVGFHKYPQSYGLRLSADGAPLGNVVTIDLGVLIRDGIFSGQLMDMAVTGTEGVMVGHAGPELGLSASFFDTQSLATDIPLPTTRLANAAPIQTMVRLARAGDAVIAGWLQQRSPAATRSVYISAGPGQPTVLVGEGALLLVDVVVEGDVVWVVWVADGLYARRYTTALQPIDAAPVQIGDPGFNPDWFDYAAAGGDGVVAVVHNRPHSIYTEDDGWESYLLRSTPAGIDTIRGGLTDGLGLNHDLAVTWNGSAFEVAWARNLGSYGDVAGREPIDDAIVTASMTTAGTVGGVKEISRGDAVESLAMARGANGKVAVVWQRDAFDLSMHRHTYAAFAGTTEVHDLGGEDLILATLVTNGNGFLLARGSVGDLQRSPVAQMEVVTLDASLRPVSTLQLPSFEIDPFLLYYGMVDAFDADLLGGASPVVGYARVAAESGGVSRLFVRDLREAPVRRRAVRH